MKLDGFADVALQMGEFEMDDGASFRVQID
jgi:hypothetical protein